MKAVYLISSVCTPLLVAGCLAPPRPALAPDIAGACRAAPALQSARTQVLWTGPSDLHSRTRLDAWCAAVGPTLFELADRPDDSGREPKLDEVTFVSWNTHVGRGDIDRLVHDLRSGRLGAGRGSRHFVLMLQETVRRDGVPPIMAAGASAAGWIGSEGSDDRAEIGTVARRLGLSVFYVPSMRNGAPSLEHLPSDRGNAILSTLPLSDLRAIELPGERQRRVALTATVQIAGREGPMPVSVATAHLDTLGGPETLWLFGATRTRSRQATSMMAELPDGPLILGADLNSWLGPNEPAARDLLRSFPSTPAGSRAPTHAAGLLLDYLFFRAPSGWRASLVRADERYGSDHHPLIGTLASEHL